MSTTISFLDLNNFHPLDTLLPENLKELAQKLDVLELNKGDAVFNEGDKNNQHTFLYKGSVELIKAGQVLKTLDAGTTAAKPAIAHIIPRNFSCTAASDVVIFKIDAELLDRMLAWDQTGNLQVEEFSNNSEDNNWITRILQTEAFHCIPPANIQSIFVSLEDVNYEAGDAVITQGEAGDYFYIIKSGHCIVKRKMHGVDKELKLADLYSGDSFGEEALISDNPRNASVSMSSNGTLSRLSKEDFLALLKEPLIKKVDYITANLKVRNGEAEWLDVRLPSEFQSAHIKDATHLPLIFLRMKINELDPEKNYILYCDTERRSSAASYLLSERGFKTSVLTNGINNLSTDDMEGLNI